MRILENLPDHTGVRAHHVRKMPAVLQVRAQEGIQVVQDLFVRRVRSLQPDADLGEGLAEEGQCLLVGRWRDEDDVPGQIRPCLHHFQSEQGGDVWHHDQPILPRCIGKTPLKQEPHVLDGGLPALPGVQVAEERALVVASTVPPYVSRVDIPAGGAEAAGERLKHAGVGGLAMTQKNGPLAGGQAAYRVCRPVAVVQGGTVRSR